MNNQLRINVAKWLGVISSVTILMLWCGIVLSKQNQYITQLIREGTWAIGSWVIDTVDVKMMIIAIAGVFIALVQKPLLIILVFLLMFYPVGLYTLGVPGWVKLVGISTLFFLSSSFLMLSTRYRITRI